MVGMVVVNPRWVRMHMNASVWWGWWNEGVNAKVMGVTGVKRGRGGHGRWRRVGMEHIKF